jgi:hypothetical protein
MQPDELFEIATQIALAGWLMLVFYPLWKHAGKVVAGISVQLLCLLYLLLIIKSFAPADFKQFGSLQGVQQLFQNPWMLLAGWVHYLAFDLMMGLYIVRDAQRKGLNHWLILPVAFLCFMLGPIGLLVYAIIVQVKSRKLYDAS